MASMIEMLGAQAVSQNAKDPMAGVADSFQGGMKTAVGLAQAKQSMAAQEQQLADAKEAAETAKFNKLNGYMSTLARTRPEIAKKMIPAMKAQLQASGIAFDPGVLDLMATDDQYKSRMNALSDVIANGSKTAEGRLEFMAAAQDVGMFTQAAEILANQSKQAQALEIANAKIAMQEKSIDARVEAARLAAERKAENTYTPFEKARDTKFATTANEFIDAGGAATVERQLDTLDEQLAQLDKGKGSGGVTGLLPSTVKDVVAPEDAAIQQNILGVVQGSMRATLGAQFTENEGKMILDRAFNPRLPPKENAKRVRAIAKEIREIAKAKQEAIDYINSSPIKSLRGFKGKTNFTIDGVKIPSSVFEGVAPSGEAPSPASGSPPPVKPNLAAAKKLAQLPDKVRAKAALEKQLGRALLAEEAALFGGP